MKHKSREFRGVKKEARREATKIGAELYSGSGPGSITKWRTRTTEILFVPDNAYTDDGIITVRPIPG